MSFSDASVPSPPEPAAAITLTPARRPEALRREAMGVALGVAFLAAAVVVSATSARDGGGLDTTVYLVGDRVSAHHLMTWPLAFGTVGGTCPRSRAASRLDLTSGGSGS